MELTREADGAEVEDKRVKIVERIDGSSLRAVQLQPCFTPPRRLFRRAMLLDEIFCLPEPKIPRRMFTMLVEEEPPRLEPLEGSNAGPGGGLGDRGGGLGLEAAAAIKGARQVWLRTRPLCKPVTCV